MTLFHKSFFRIFFLICLFSLSALSAQANTIDDLKTKISAHNSTIDELEEEIKSYQTQIDAVGKQADSLKNTLASLALSRKKLEASLAVTQNKIDSTNLQIKQLSLQITDKASRIGDSKRVIAQALSSISQTDSTSLLENLLGAHSLSDAWNGVEELSSLQTNVANRIHELETIKVSLESNKTETEAKKKELVSLQKDLSNQKKVIAETTKQQNAILTETKNTESNYKKILAQKEAQKNKLEQELMAYESALKIAIDPNKLPETGKGILGYPLTKINITQYFGNTPFSTKNPQIYSGKGHTGVDFAASIGTPVLAAHDGIVVGVANTDIVRTCYSFGKWVMVKHPNGLSTLYAHLSLQTVSIGNTVDRGQVVGYSGNTGYSTGPHLHFGVYATEGVRITSLTRQNFPGSGCAGTTLPLADPKAYLNPLSYF